MPERGVAVEHSTRNRWVSKYAPEFEKQCRRRQRPVGKSWRREERYVRGKGQWKYWDRAVEKDGHPVDFLLPPHRDSAAAACLFRALRTHGLPEKRTSEPSGSTTAALAHYPQGHKTALVLRPSTYLHNLVAQAQRAGKRRPRPLRGCNSFWAACGTIAGMEVRPALCQGPLLPSANRALTPAEQFYAVAA